MGRYLEPIPVGTEFGRLTVIGPAEMKNRRGVSLCRCSCGVEKKILNSNLKGVVGRNATRSCGCLHKENVSARVKKNPPRLIHGGSKTITYDSWQSMIGRCYNQKNTNYARYGARGITVCRKWRDPQTGFLSFLADMGERPSKAHSIDRINGGNYAVKNCRWATRSQQNQNVGLKKSNTSGYKGVNAHWFRWTAEIRNNGKKHYLGLFLTKEEAALAYNIASERLQGVFGVRNSLPSMSKEVTKRVFEKVNSVIPT